MLLQKKYELASILKDETMSEHNMSARDTSNLETQPSNNSYSQNISRHTCQATKCRILWVKGILLWPMYCSNNKSMCSGCYSEVMRHKQTFLIEQTLLNDTTSNAVLAPLIQHLTEPTSLRNFRHMMEYLHTVHKPTARDDYIYGAMRYTANSLGIQLTDDLINDRMDQPLTAIEIKQNWRIATFRC
jgi:hypothetical protein